MAEWLGRWTCDQQVASSNPGLSALECNPGQVVSTHVSLSPSSIIWYRPMDGDALRLEGNRRSGVALAMRHMAHFTFTFYHVRSSWGLRFLSLTTKGFWLHLGGRVVSPHTPIPPRTTDTINLCNTAYNISLQMPSRLTSKERLGVSQIFMTLTTSVY